MKLMIVDDSDLDRFLADKLIAINFQLPEPPLFFETAQKALDFLEAHKGDPATLPEIILLDIKMPDIDGFGFLERFSSLPEEVRAKCRITMVTSSIDPTDMKRANSNQYVSGYIIKPLSKEKLQELFERR